VVFIWSLEVRAACGSYCFHTQPFYTEFEGQVKPGFTTVVRAKAGVFFRGGGGGGGGESII